jgi:hypothetical protein
LMSRPSTLVAAIPFYTALPSARARSCSDWRSARLGTGRGILQKLQGTSRGFTTICTPAPCLRNSLTPYRSAAAFRTLRRSALGTSSRVRAVLRQYLHQDITLSAVGRFPRSIEMERLNVKGSSEHVSNLLSVSPDGNYRSPRWNSISVTSLRNLSQALLVDLIP